ncbi:MAG TPA: hypothetical protein VMM84_18775 [Pyrinomonadaceae bacterium]|nr:hypothetical protein [Pyrinomonadaceae bacterium]
MLQGLRIRKKLLLLFGLLLFVSPHSYAFQDQAKKKAPEGPPILWREPTDIAARDLLLGPGGEEMKPDLSRLTFIEEQKGGYSKKYRVRDAQGRVWVAKLGKEAQSETAAARLVWAVGYMSEINYLAPRATIEGKGTFENVRFEARPENVKREDEWRWDSNPFGGSRELQGLKVLMALMENWDLKNSNNRVLVVSRNGHNELHYIISDLGATFGKTGGQWSPIAFIRKIKGSRNDPEDYANDEFVEEVDGKIVRLDYNGKNSSMMRHITVSDAKWIGGWLSRLSDNQIQDAFRAANYSSVEVRMLAGAVRKRINQLVNLQSGGTISGVPSTTENGPDVKRD